MAYHKHDRVTSCTFAQRHQCRLAGLQDTQTWHHLRQHVIDALQTEVQAQTPEDAITTIHNQVSIAFHQFFPNQNSSSRTVDHSQAYRHITDKWYHKKRLTQLAETVFPGIQVLFRHGTIEAGINLSNETSNVQPGKPRTTCFSSCVRRWPLRPRSTTLTPCFLPSINFPPRNQWHELD
jgi:hypothetical protein